MAALTPADKEQLRALHEMRPGPGLAQLTLRLAVQAALVASCLSAFAQSDYLRYAVLALGSAAWFGGLLSLTHDALHHRLTGIRVLDDAAARIIAWPIGWPISVYTRVHLAHHRWSGGSFNDPERIQPTRAEYDAASGLKRWYFRNQVWFNIFVAGGAGLLARLVTDAWRHRGHIPLLGRSAAADAAGFLLVTALWVAIAHSIGGWHLVAGGAGLWLLTERAVGVTHQVRNHAEHYGLWGARATHAQTQYQTARDINPSRLAAWYFNHLNRHATHHALVGVPYYNLERAHAYLRDAFARQSVPVIEARGYLAEVLAANRLARRGGFIDDQPVPTT